MEERYRSSIQRVELGKGLISQEEKGDSIPDYKTLVWSRAATFCERARKLEILQYPQDALLAGRARGRVVLSRCLQNFRGIINQNNNHRSWRFRDLALFDGSANVG
jgi:hypothetical protein